MKKIYTILILYLSSNVNAQSVSPFVISTSGGFYSSGSGQLSGTAGEMTMVETITGTGNYLTQGFQQPFDFGVSVEEIVNEAAELILSPNPGNGNFTIKLDVNEKTLCNVIVYSSVGQQIFNNEIDLNKGFQEFNIDLSGNANGIYLFDMFLNNESIHITRKIQILN